MKILLPIDQSQFSQEALRTLLSLVRPERNQVHVLHVIEHSPLYVSADMVPHIVKETEHLERERVAEARVLVNRAAARLRGAGIRARGVVEKGDAKSVIINYARTWGANLIVVGSHGLKGLGRVLMGSVSNALIHHADCSVQVVRVPTTKRRAKRKTRSTGRTQSGR